MALDILSAGVGGVLGEDSMVMLVMVAAGFFLLGLIGAAVIRAARKQGYLPRYGHRFPTGTIHHEMEIVDELLTEDEPTPQQYVYREFVLAALIFLAGLAVAVYVWWSRWGQFGG